MTVRTPDRDHQATEGQERAFTEQVETLVARGYPELAGMSAEAFRELLRPLAAGLPSNVASEHVPFVVVVPPGIVPVDRAAPLLELRGRAGFTDMPAEDLERFVPIEGLDVPAVPYLLTGVDTGGDLVDVTPEDALPVILERGRSPLTLAEGVALVTQYPQVLRERNCFSLLGSRCGDRRVTAVWVSRGRPRIGWCWAGNPHTWLGSASCSGRVTAS